MCSASLLIQLCIRRFATIQVALEAAENRRKKTNKLTAKIMFHKKRFIHQSW